MKFSSIFLIIFFLYSILFIDKCNSQLNSKLQQWIFRVTRNLVWTFTEDKKITYHDNKLEGKAQQTINSSTKFFCDTRNARSKSIPNSIHHLRPGDIDIIAVIGASISAGNAEISNSVVHMLREHRGVSFPGGGLANWRKFFTLPNILKEFNPNIYGYATDDSYTRDRKSKFHIAEPMLMSQDLPFSSKVLVARIKADPNVNLKKNWKLLTIFIGNLDICVDLCYQTNLDDWIKRFESNLVKALRILRNNIPRLYINIVSLPNLVRLLHSIKLNTSTCYFIHRIACPCLAKSNYKEDDLVYYENGIKMWNEKELEISLRDEFQTEEFSVNVQPFLSNFSFDLNADGKINYNFIANDCFHFSQRGHAIAAIFLWNNMLQPIGKKYVGAANERTSFLCPSEQYPYLATYKNIQTESWRPNISEPGARALRSLAENL